jgi:hypothetical protein
MSIEYNKRVYTKNPLLTINDTDIDDKNKDCQYILKEVYKSKDSGIYSEKDLKIMLLYSYNGDILINNYLRNNKKIDKNLLDYFHNHYYKTFHPMMENIFYGDTLRFIKTYIQNIYYSLKECFKTSFNENVIVYRGLKTDPMLNKGNIIQNNFFISTTCNIYKAYEFSSNIIFEIEIPKNIKICPVLLNSRFSQENEILLEDNTIFYIKDILYKEKYKIYHLIIVDKELNSDNLYLYDKLKDQILFNKFIDNDIMEQMDFEFGYNKHLRNKSYTIIDNSEMPKINDIIDLQSISIDSACETGNVSILDYLFRIHLKIGIGENFPSYFESKYTTKAIDYASMFGHLNILKWWYDMYIKYNVILKYTGIAMNRAFNSEILEWWENSNLELIYDEDIFTMASKLEILNWWEKFFNYKDRLIRRFINPSEVLNTILNSERTDIFIWWINHPNYDLANGLKEMKFNDKYLDISSFKFKNPKMLELLISYYEDDNALKEYVLYSSKFYEYFTNILAYEQLNIYINYCIKKKLYINYDPSIIDNLSDRQRRNPEQLKIIEIIKLFVKLKLNGGYFNYIRFHYNTKHNNNKLLYDFWLELSKKYDFITLTF